MLSPVALLLALVASTATAMDSPLLAQTAVAVIAPTLNSTIRGTVFFSVVQNDGVSYKDTVGGAVISATDFPYLTKVVIALTDTTQNATHGLHVHSFGDVSDLIAGNNTGPHFKVGNQNHTCSLVTGHAGDLGNIEAVNGVISTTIYAPQLSLDPASKNSIVGRAVVVHSAADDCTTQPSGNSGKRIGQGVIASSLATGDGNTDAAISFSSPAGAIGSLYFHQASASDPVYYAAGISVAKSPSVEFGMYVHTKGDFDSLIDAANCKDAVMKFKTDASSNLTVTAASFTTVTGFNIFSGEKSIVGRSAAIVDCGSGKVAGYGVVGMRNTVLAKDFIPVTTTTAAAYTTAAATTTAAVTTTASVSSATPATTETTYGGEDTTYDHYLYHDHDHSYNDNAYTNDKDTTGTDYTNTGDNKKDATGSASGYSYSNGDGNNYDTKDLTKDSTSSSSTGYVADGPQKDAGSNVVAGTGSMYTHKNSSANVYDNSMAAVGVSPLTGFVIAAAAAVVSVFMF